MSTDSNKIDLDSLLREQEAANSLGFTPRTLQAWRLTGDGPAYIKISSRAIRYRRRDLIAWADERRRLSTSNSSSPKEGGRAHE